MSKSNGRDDDRPLTNEQEQLFTATLAALTEIVDDLKEEAESNKGRLPSREFAMVLTKLEEAEMWCARAFEELDYEVPFDAVSEEVDDGDGSDDEDDSEGGDRAEPEDKADT